MSVQPTLKHPRHLQQQNPADNQPLARPLGLSIKFKLPDGSATGIVSHSANGFLSATANDFRDPLKAQALSPAGTPSPTPIVAYLDIHPAAKAFVKVPKPAPFSYATLPYFGVNTFKFTNAAGKITAGRYQFLPVIGVRDLKARRNPPRPPRTTCRKTSPAKWQRLACSSGLYCQIAEPGDALDDPSKAWPDIHRRVELGMITLDASTSRTQWFMHARLPMPFRSADGNRSKGRAPAMPFHAM